MQIRSLAERREGGFEKVLSGGLSRSVRHVLASDGLGFSLNFNLRAPGRGRQLWYRHHWEANYVFAGSVAVEDLTSGETWQLAPGALYTVGPDDRHRLDAHEETRMVSVFCPPLQGDEAHDEDGAYAPSGPLPGRTGRMFLRTVDELRARGAAGAVPMLTPDDRLGFSLWDVRVPAGGGAHRLHAGHHEVQVVIGGTGDATDEASGAVHPLEFGSLLLAAPGDACTLAARTDLHLVGVAAPPAQAAR